MKRSMIFFFIFSYKTARYINSAENVAIFQGENERFSGYLMVGKLVKRARNGDWLQAPKLKSADCDTVGDDKSVRNAFETV